MTLPRSTISRSPTGDQRWATTATRSAASSRGWRFTARRGSDVSTTQIVSLAGSAQQSVPVEPVCPKVCSEHPGLPDPLPTPNPNPRGVNPSGASLHRTSSSAADKKGHPFAKRAPVSIAPLSPTATAFFPTPRCETPNRCPSSVPAARHTLGASRPARHTPPFRWPLAAKSTASCSLGRAWTAAAASVPRSLAAVRRSPRPTPRRMS
jgi:hypothetical protein